jgi:hypothetical protein
VLGAVVLALICSLKVKLTFAKYNKTLSSRGEPAHIVARKLLDAHGLYNVGIEHVHGNLTDHYDPRCNTVRLSDATYNSASVGAIGIAAHECGHAFQYAEAYAPVRIRSGFVPVVNIANRTWMFVVIAGMFMQLPYMMSIGVIAFGAATVFQFITLPVEIDASRRALYSLDRYDILAREEMHGAKKTLSAAALTYIAALAVSLAQFLRILAISRGGRRR